MNTHTRTILITGGTGFLGRRLVAKLTARKYRVVVLTRQAKALTRSARQSNIVYYNYEQGVQKCFSNYAVDTVVHLATRYGHDHDSYSDVVRANVLLPLELLECGITNGLKRFINADTFFTEDLGLPPKEQSYTSTKKLFLKLATNCIVGSTVSFMNARIEQMYGPGDSKEKFFSSTLAALMAQQPKLNLTAGKQRRDFVYVDDVADAFVKMVQLQSPPRQFMQYYIGTGKSLAIWDAVRTMKRLAKSNTELCWGVLPYRKNEIMDSKAKLANNRTIGWKARTKFEDGVRKTIRFYHSH